ncbi:DUF2510 domain-containing protein [Protaetiibacter mangrovi]|uniref:DUF2510 domain-containing protein n=1 Tax=Protaetiibacter mangrovi TaxID=2970926 RepID=A0ABT1ZBE3_9MICO|nr:DUF2510 domain-containing protein [Protaetiibacter mangrovi]MCS0498010.1 DUF2510 domain-containing protein [Protaetiibacter mangrovi]
MAEEEGHVPAGWYPDPLGLPQLRWWDNHAWTEHTSDARQPMVAQETVTAKLAYADDDEYLSHDVREDLHTDFAGGTPAAEPAFAPADPVLSLEAAPSQTRLVEEVSPGLKYAQEHVIEDAPTSAPFLLDTSYDDLLGVPIDPSEAQQAAPRPSFSPSPVFDAMPTFQVDPNAASGLGTFTTTNFDPSAFGNFSYAPSVLAEHDGSQPLTRRAVLAENGLSVNTGPVWIIALMPVIMLVLALMFLVAGNAGQDSALFAGIILFGSYIATVILAIVDRAMLRRAGHSRTANWDWAFLGAPVYLIARMSNVVRETGRGLRPFLTWSALTIVLIGSSVAIPGIVMALAPGVFSDEAEQSISEQAGAIGASVNATCPDVPPLLVGDTMICSAVTPTKVANVVVSLQRKNGWIDWRVDDWGVFSTNR